MEVRPGSAVENSTREIEAHQMVNKFGRGEVRENHQIDMQSLTKFLQRELAGFENIQRIEQFRGGQSNPTYLLHTNEQAVVLRKKPPGKLLPSAHMIEREYRIYEALADTDVPVPKIHLLCEDPSIIGTPFFVMEFIDGVVYENPNLPDMAPERRRVVYLEMVRAMAALHCVEYSECGLSDFGKPGNYFVRQTGRWTKQYLAAQTEEISSMTKLIDWLPENMPSDDLTTIVHGDFQLYNMLYSTTDNQCLALLDWELSTLGNPLADLAYNCMKYHDGSVIAERPVGIPSEQEVVEEYCRLTGRADLTNWDFCLAFSFFRLASIVQGVYKRGLQGNASSDSALEYKEMVHRCAETAWKIACRS